LNNVPYESRWFYRRSKRSLDIAVSGAVLLLFAPVMAAVAVLVRLRMGSPVIFRHPRPGYREVIFDCLKFRTMTNARDAQGNLLGELERLTPLGKLLRRLSLDELPQLWSVLKGDMSLVGPRPLEVRYLPRYSAEQRRRQTVPPGITGWAQINGRNEIEWERRLALDVWYVDHCSLALDLKILLLTVWKVGTAAGIAKAGHASIEEFFGTNDTRRMTLRHDAQS
jgi:lipopolysaccharide/colanic/teichoic acid biosynthesis glycosyltransferase